ncbi:hypothetical protein GCM10010492_19260 [Saccharothrix mutabilis subsp. mutabilis]|uniref:Regulator protein n=1 Tax=Saccharothrix mutabilis subsp. mutabilis TaxID=66855 RepID=A0ABN0TGR6_9PSEU
MKPDISLRAALDALSARNGQSARLARNEVSAPVLGGVVQANVIDEVTVVTPAPPARMKRPRQLPPAPHGFVNRRREIERIEAAATGGGERGAAIVVLSGMAGVGKTACALQWAHRHADRFDGGHLFADLDGYRHHGGIAVTDVAGAFLRALGVPWDYIPPDLPERVALFRSLTARSRVLVVLDGADHAAQIRSLVPTSPGSVVLATSRRRLSGLAIDGAHTVELRPLDDEHGATLVAHMVRDDRVHHDPSATRRLVDLCAGLPIALKVVGAELGRLERWTVARYAQHLSDDRKRLSRLSVEGDHLVEHVFDAAYDDLSAPARRMYRVLGLHPGGDFDAGVAAAMADTPAAEAEEQLAALRAVNLVEEHAADRYRFHDLVRLHAAHRAEREGADERDDVRRRAVEWYLLGAAAADRAVLGPARWRLADHDLRPWPVEFDAGSGMEWFETERTNLLAAVRLAADIGLHTAAWQLCEALWAFYHSRKHYADWIEAHRIGAESAAAVGARAAECRLRNQLARAHVELRDFEAAKAELSRAERVIADNGLGRAMVHESYGLLLREQERYDDAAREFESALLISRRLGDPRAIGVQAYQFGDALVRAGKAALALPVLEEARRLLERLRDEMSTARVHIALGRAYEALRRVADARRVLTAAIATTRSRRQPVKEAQALEVMVVIAREQRDEDLFRVSAQRLFELYRDAGNPRSAEVLRWFGSRG